MIRPPLAAGACARTVLAALTVLIAAMATRTVIAARRRLLFPPTAGTRREHGIQPPAEPDRMPSQPVRAGRHRSGCAGGHRRRAQ